MYKSLIRSQSGFTFLSNLMELVILLMLLPLITLFFLVAGSIFEAVDPKQLEWELFSADLRTYLDGITSIEVINGGAGIRTMQGEAEFDIELYDRLIRKQKFRQGHEIMLTGISRCRFEVRNGYLFLQASFTNGLEKDEQYAFTLFSE